MNNWKKIILLSSLAAIVKSESVEDVGQLPHCVDEQDVGYVLVSTLDGKLTALRANGKFAWDVDTGTGPLLTSSIHNVELTNNGEWVRIIPSLTGSLYKFNGKTIDAIPINADTLLKSSFVYSSDIVIAGGRDVRTYGVVAKTGETLYECSSAGCRNLTETREDFDDIIVIERSTTTVRAHEPRTGNERWNFSVGYHDIKIPPASCINLDSAITSLNLSAILPQGILSASRTHHAEQLWQYVFETPIVKIWKWDGRDLSMVDVFDQARPHEQALTVSPAIYLGMHKQQLYIHESMRMLHALQRNVQYTSNELIETKSLTRFPWKPIPAGHLQEEVDDSTALSILYSSNYVDGNGYYFYTEVDVQKSNTIFCETNNNTSRFFNENSTIAKNVFYTIGFVIITAVVTRFHAVYTWMTGSKPSEDETKSQSRDTSAQSYESVTTIETTSSTPSIYNDARPIQSHFQDNFNIISQLGKGGYGIVFEVQQKIDKINYAVKIIPLPQRLDAKERVLREVRALAQLDHPNIVRYSTSWDEEMLPDFAKLKHLNPFLADTSIFSSDIYDEDEDDDESKIEIDNDSLDSSLRLPAAYQDGADEDSFIVFEDETKSNSTRTRSNSTRITVQSDTETDTNTNTNITRSQTSREPRSRKYSIKDLTNQKKDRRYLFIQMQLCDKLTLKHWMVKNLARSPNVIYEIYAQILSAVEYIHSKQLIHRDLKPSNIFFNQNGSASQIKVGDFGLVTPMKNADDVVSTADCYNSGHTRDTGTALYMSPEQKQGSNYNYKVDVYSLGVILFELLVFFGTENERIDKLQKLRRDCFPDHFQQEKPKEYALLKLMLSPKSSERPNVTDIITKISNIQEEETL